MTTRTRLRLTLAGILLLTVLAGLVSWPSGPDLRFGPFDREVKVLLGLDLQGGTSLLYNADVTEIPEQERGSSLEGVRDVIERRINAFGVGEPNIQTVRSGDEWRILVELPGVTDITEAINRIGETPLLEFKTEGEPPELTEEEKQEIRDRNAERLVEAESVLERARSGESFADLATEFSEDPGSAQEGGSLGEFGRGVMVPEFEQAVFEDAPVGEVYDTIVESDFGYHIILVEARTVAAEGEEEAADSEENTEESADQNDQEAAEDAAVAAALEDSATASHILFRKEQEEPIQLIPTYDDTGLTGEQLERADVVFDPTTGLPTVSLTFNREGRDLFAQITREHTGETIAIYLDDSVISAPVVNEEINTGEAVITGDFTLDEAQELSQRLNAGALPVPITLVSQQNVGPSLGQASIERSFFAGVVGLLLLSIFMIVYYRLPGVMAVIALFIYSLLVLAVFKLWPITLTLAGIAGFILSIGMAVDSNVLIFERMKEELRRGKPVRQSIEDGFARAWTSIRDSNVSSLITCLILYWFGTSIIRGFAITLAIGIVISLFSAITITRSLLWASKTNRLRWYGVKQSE